MSGVGIREVVQKRVANLVRTRGCVAANVGECSANLNVRDGRVKIRKIVGGTRVVRVAWSVRRGKVTLS